MAPNPVSERFRAVLEARRESFNQRFARRGRSLDPATFLAFLRRTVDPLVDAAGDTAAETVATTLFDVGLVALERGLVGAGDGADADAASPFERALLTSLPRFGRHWTDSPAIVTRAAANGYERLRRALDDERAAAWLSGWSELAGACAARDELLDAGLVLAWKAGLAEARARALACAATRGAAFATRTLGAAAIDARPERRFVAPGAPADTPVEIAVVARVAGFSGFGGPFRVPPTVTAVGDHVVASDGETPVVIHADVFGARVLPAPWAAEGASGAAAPQALCHTDEVVRRGFGAFVLDHFRDVTSVASAAGMAAVTTAASHQVAIVGWRARGAP